MMVRFTAVNAKQLDAQIARETAILKEMGGDIYLVVGRARTTHKLWYIYEDYGVFLKDQLTFAELVEEAERRFSWAYDALETLKGLESSAAQEKGLDISDPHP